MLPMRPSPAPVSHVTSLNEHPSCSNPNLTLICLGTAASAQLEHPRARAPPPILLLAQQAHYRTRALRSGPVQGRSVTGHVFPRFSPISWFPGSWRVPCPIQAQTATHGPRLDIGRILTSSTAQAGAGSAHGTVEPPWCNECAVPAALTRPIWHMQGLDKERERPLSFLRNGYLG